MPVTQTIRTAHAYLMIILTLLFGGALSGPRR